MDRTFQKFSELWCQLYKDRVRSLQHWSICTQLSVSSCVSVTQTWLFDDFITNCILQYFYLVLDFTSDLHPCETLKFRWVLPINKLLFIHFRVGNWSEIPKCLGWTKVNNLLLGCCTSGLTFDLEFLLWNQNRQYVFPNWEWCALTFCLLRKPVSLQLWISANAKGVLSALSSSALSS